MADKGITKEEAQQLVDGAVKILREDAQLAHNKALMERLDKLEEQTRKEPKTPEEKAAEYDRLMAEQRRNSGSGNPQQSGGQPQPPAAPGQPTPPNAKPPAPSTTTENDWWWGPSE